MIKADSRMNQNIFSINLEQQRNQSSLISQQPYSNLMNQGNGQYQQNYGSPFQNYGNNNGGILNQNNNRLNSGLNSQRGGYQTKANLALSGEIALGKNMINSPQQLSGRAYQNEYQEDQLKSRGSSQPLYNQRPQQSPYIQLKVASPTEIAQAQNSLRLLKQKMQKNENINQQAGSKIMEIFKNEDEKNQNKHQSNNTNNYRKVFNVQENLQEQDSNNNNNNYNNNNNNEIIMKTPASFKQNNDINSKNIVKQSWEDQKQHAQIMQKFHEMQKDQIKMEYQSSMQRQLEKQDPQMMYNAQRYNQMQGYQYKQEEGNDDEDDDDFQFISNIKKRPVPQKATKKKQIPIISQNLLKANIENIENQRNFKTENAESEDNRKPSTYRGEVDGKKYYNFNTNANTNRNQEEDEEEAEIVSNQKFKPNLIKSSPSKQEFLDLPKATKQIPQPPKPQIQAKSNNYPSIQQQSNEYQPQSQLEECPEGCGRKFAPEALERHSKICNKVFQQKRKKFDARGQRQPEDDGSDEDEYEKRTAPYKKQTANSNNKQNAQPKWKMQSQQFRAILQNNKDGGKGPIASDPALDDRIECQHCNRKFNEQTLQKHEPICGNRARIAKASGKPFGKK